MGSELRRRCGFRKVGALYLVTGPLSLPCCRFPVPLEVCQTCGQGIKQTQGWTWVSPSLLGEDRPDCGSMDRVSIARNPWPCLTAHPSFIQGPIGLLWIGRRFYPQPSDFLDEARVLGVSKRLRAIPHGFTPGQTLVAFAHPLAITRLQPLTNAPPTEPPLPLAVEPAYTPGIIMIARPQWFEKIYTKATLTAEEMAKCEHRGIRPIVVAADDPDHLGSVYEKAGDIHADRTGLGGARAPAS